MDLCGPMRIASINGKRYVLVIIDDYSRYTCLHFLRSKDEAPKVIKTFLKRITILLQSPVIIIRTNNDTEFKNQVFKEYFDSVGISHQVSSIRTPQQNGVVEHKNRTLVEAARTMLIFSRAPLFLWAEAIATACFTQNRSIIHPAPRTVSATQAHHVHQTPTTSTSIADTAPTPTNSSSQATNFPNTSHDVDGLNSQQQHAQRQGNQAIIQPKTVADNVSNAMFDANTFVNPFATPSTS
nr:putative ribonuclease H-like domain-containing protein [Tanacetum cinerariifolium]